MLKKNTYNINIALLFIWSAMFLYGCSDSVPKIVFNRENSPVMVVDSLRLKYSEDGALSYVFETPEMKRFEKNDSVYMVFEKGVKVITYSLKDSVLTIESTLTANYAFYDENFEKWEARGDVVSLTKDGKQVFTEQLFWDQRAKLIHSFVKTVVVDGSEKIIGLNGFTANESMTDIQFRNSQGRFLIDTTKTVTDTLANENVPSKIEGNPIQKEQSNLPLN